MSDAQASDIFSAYEKSTDEFFAGIKKSIPNYHQSITDLQQEWLQTCESTIKSMISLQRDLADKVGTNPVIPESILKMIQRTNEEILGAYSIQAMMVLDAINATRQNIKTFNDNTVFFTEMNRNVAKFWASVFAQKTV